MTIFKSKRVFKPWTEKLQSFLIKVKISYLSSSFMIFRYRYSINFLILDVYSVGIRTLVPGRMIRKCYYYSINHVYIFFVTSRIIYKIIFTLHNNHQEQKGTWVYCTKLVRVPSVSKQI